MSRRALTMSVLSAAAALTLVATAEPAWASTTYSCPLGGSSPCVSPLSGSVNGDITISGGAYEFDPNADGSAAYVQVNNSNQIPMNQFPITVSVDVMGVGVPSSLVGDYDVVRGSKGANWKIEVVARNRRGTAKASCYFKGTTGKGAATGGPDLSKLTGWHTITCTDTGGEIDLSVDGIPAASKSVSTGSIPNIGTALIGAKNTTGGDQFSGWARNMTVQVP